MAQDLTAIILTGRAEIRNVIRDELKRVGIKTANIMNVATADEAEAAIIKTKQGLLVLDWDIGADICLSVLEHNHAKGKVDSHPIYLITSKVDENIVAAATEFHASKIHTGEITATNIRDSIKALYQEVVNVTPIKTLLQKVAELRVAGLYDNVHEILHALYEKTPQNTRIAVEYGANLIELGKLDKAEEVLLPVANAEPPNPRAKHLLAKIFLKQNNPARAIASLQGAQLISPYNVDRLVEMGNIFLDINQPKNAKNSFDQILTFAPDSKEGVKGKGAAMLAMGEVNEALSLLKDSTSTHELASIFNTSAIISIKKGHHKQAMSLYRTALNAVGKSKKVEAKLWFNMGIGHVKAKDLDNSIECFRKATSLDPTFENAQHNIDIVERSLGKRKSPKQAKTKTEIIFQPNASEQKRVSGEGDSFTLGDGPDHDLGEIEETLGAENLDDTSSLLSFDLDFDDDDFDD